MVGDPVEIVLGKAVGADAFHTVNSLVITILYTCELIFKTDRELADVVDHGRCEPPHLVHIREAVLAEIEVCGRSVAVLGAVEIVFRSEILHIASKKDPLCLLSVHKAHPSGRVAGRGIFITYTVILHTGYTIATIEVEMLSSFCESSLELCGEQPMLILTIDKRSESRDTITYLLVPSAFIVLGLIDSIFTPALKRKPSLL